MLKIAKRQFAIGISKERNFRFTTCFYAFIFFVILTHYGCVTQQNLLAEKDEYIANIRSIVLDRIEILSEQEKIFIMQSDPEVRQYNMAGMFGQYGWIWNVPTGRSIHVSYIGDITKFDKDEVIIKLDEANK
jgi:hypothetical protein